MEEKKRAWLYCRIDAPEDLHGALKNQRQQLMDYAEQMGFEVTGSSEDTGTAPGSECPGLLRAVRNVKEQSIQALLIGQPCFGMAADIIQPTLHTLAAAGIEIYSPMEGKIKFI